MTDTPPDRLAASPDSPFFDAALLERGVGVRFNGQEKTNVEEYCVSEGWIRVAAVAEGPPGPAADLQAQGQGRALLPRLTVGDGSARR